jgi:hypothetical protein
MTMKSLSFSFIALLLNPVFVAPLSGSAMAQTETTQRLAVGYLEPRVHEWMATKGCVSCHNALPYAVGRITPDAVNSSTFQEIEQLVTSRAQNFDSMEPWYAYEKADMSKATESVLNSLILTQIDTVRGRTTPSQATLLSFAKMKQLQREDGSWLWLNFELDPWENVTATAYGVSLAAVAVARSPIRNQVQYAQMISKMKAYLVKANQDPASSLWTRMSILWADSELGGILNPSDYASLLTDILSKQLPTGGFSENQFGNWKKQGTQVAAGEFEADGYASAYAEYVLKKVIASGRAPLRLTANLNSAYTRGLDWIVRSQNAQGYWESASVNVDDPFNQSLVEDAAAGFALAVIAP